MRGTIYSQTIAVYPIQISNNSVLLVTGIGCTMYETRLQIAAARSIDLTLNTYPATLGREPIRSRHWFRLSNPAGISIFAKSAKPRPAYNVISAIEKLSPAT